MKTISVEIKGISPLIMHSCRSVNPLDPLVVEMKKLTGKRKKTEEDLVAISDIEWELSLYWDDTIGLYIPAENIEATVREGAKNAKKGKHIERGFNVMEMLVPLDIGEKVTKEQMRHDYRFRDVRAMRVQQSRVMRTRGRFNMWRCDFTASYDESVLSFGDIVDALEYAGKCVGLCDSRPRYGKFVSKITELD